MAPEVFGNIGIAHKVMEFIQEDRTIFLHFLVVKIMERYISNTDTDCVDVYTLITVSLFLKCYARKMTTSIVYDWNRISGS